MSLVCPRCGSDRFRILDALEKGRSVDWDERTVQRASCGACKRRFICTYFEKRSFSRNGRDQVVHQAYENRLLLWFVAAAVFTTPSRKRSAAWRLWILDTILNRWTQTSPGPALPIGYKPKR